MSIPLAPAPTLKKILVYGLVYLLWFVNSAVCVGVLIQFISTVNVFGAALGGDLDSLSMVNQVGILVGGFVAFAYVVMAGMLYLESVPQVAKIGIRDTVKVDASTRPQARLAQRLKDWGLDLLLRRFAITTAIPLGVWLALLLVLEFALRSLVR